MLQELLEPHVQRALRTIGAPEGVDVVFQVPKQEGQGDLCTTVAMLLAKPMGKAPRAIAEDIRTALGTVPGVESMDIAGPGFINFTFSTTAYAQALSALVALGDDIGRSTIGHGKSVNVEYVSANPTGPLHAGHGRNCAVGDTIANLYAWCGFSTTREYYFNNAGNQMNKLGESIAARVLELVGRTEELSFPEDGYHGDYIRTIAETLVAEHQAQSGDAALASVDVLALKAIARKAGETWCFASIKATLEQLGIRHDVYFNEDSLYAEGKVAATVDALRAAGLVYEKDGATWFALTQLGNAQDKVILKSSGEPTYRLPDIAYHRDKLERGYDNVVDILGADHIATVPDVLAGVRALGFNTERVRVIIHQMVTFIENDEVVKFSKRSGKSFTLDELIDEVGADVVRFFFVMRTVGTQFDFDLGLAKEEGDKNPVFYLQYAHARICSILRKGLDKGLVVNPQADVALLVHPAETELIGLLTRMQAVLERACTNMEPHTVCEYLRDLAGAYHTFYHDCRILGEATDIEGARLLLADVTRRAMRNGLHLLGVSAPEVM